MPLHLADRIWGPPQMSRDHHDGPTYGWIHLRDGLCQVQLTLYRVTTTRPRSRRTRISWEVDWETDLDNPTFAPIPGDALPVTEDAVRNGTWDLLACVLLRHELYLNPERYGLSAAT
ncbi:hypothetical protein ABZ470_39365 [Streptosporangium sp. NPDC020072]|uniref:hypothetical protein n=1 Tax=Streptosporangium sp. NPDC020072 TaxID=3154788 RepID=UPI00341B8AAF